MAVLGSVRGQSGSDMRFFMQCGFVSLSLLLVLSFIYDIKYVPDMEIPYSYESWGLEFIGTIQSSRMVLVKILDLHSIHIMTHLWRGTINHVHKTQISNRNFSHPSRAYIRSEKKFPT